MGKMTPEQLLATRQKRAQKWVSAAVKDGRLSSDFFTPPLNGLHPDLEDKYNRQDDETLRVRSSSTDFQRKCEDVDLSDDHKDRLTIQHDVRHKVKGVESFEHPTKRQLSKFENKKGKVYKSVKNVPNHPKIQVREGDELHINVFNGSTRVNKYVAHVQRVTPSGLIRTDKDQTFTIDNMTNRVALYDRDMKDDEFNYKIHLPR